MGLDLYPFAFIAGVYGMNFKHIPELGRPWNYPMARAVMIIADATMVMVPKKRTWL